MGKKKVFSPLKWQIVGLLKSGDKKQNEIANMLETGTVSDRSRSGRPRKLAFRDENYIFREIRKDPTSSYQKLAIDFNSKTQGVRINISGVNRDLSGHFIRSSVYQGDKKGQLVSRDAFPTKALV
ncbi:hypothetical protein BpHYR1_027500 [Brachionus plicatilis]|uniref:Uncharacterized protein n=1 Tax=Brachionus plicatilis TaxID=10195 RepID=A0A3M7RYS3_BRAPC|nr:hypothetical protein BpHYR1_027500 [Brachionus plicatilis]